MRPGHTLLIPKTHVVRLADLDPASAGKMGMALPKVVNAVCEATGNPDLNVVCNQGESSQRVPIRFDSVWFGWRGRWGRWDRARADRFLWRFIAGAGLFICTGYAQAVHVSTAADELESSHLDKD